MKTFVLYVRNLLCTPKFITGKTKKKRRKKEEKKNNKAEESIGDYNFSY